MVFTTSSCLWMVRKSMYNHWDSKRHEIGTHSCEIMIGIFKVVCP
jgi:hypothetical protein